MVRYLTLQEMPGRPSLAPFRYLASAEEAIVTGLPRLHFPLGAQPEETILIPSKITVGEKVLSKEPGKVAIPTIVGCGA